LDTTKSNKISLQKKYRKIQDFDRKNQNSFRKITERDLVFNEILPK